jgi:hypothetical protein
MKEKTIKVGFCVSYDWMLLKKSIPPIYKEADTICLSIDKNRKTWNGQSYAFDEVAFRDFICTVDIEKKIDIYEDEFFIPQFSAMENDTNQRLLMAKRMGTGGWHIQIDSDEYFLNFRNFVSRLKTINNKPTGNEKPLNVCVLCIPLIKRLSSGFLYVDFKNKTPETFPVATTRPAYVRARLSGHFNIIIPEYVIHETWARSDDDLWHKINNWGHSSEELDGEKRKLSYYNLWKSLDDFNFHYVNNFHPAIAETWPALQYMEADSVEELLCKIDLSLLSFPKGQLWMKNNRNIARFKSIVKRIFNR